MSQQVPILLACPHPSGTVHTRALLSGWLGVALHRLSILTYAAVLPSAGLHEGTVFGAGRTRGTSVFKTNAMGHGARWQGGRVAPLDVCRIKEVLEGVLEGNR